MLAGAAAAYGNPEGVTAVSGGWSPRVHLWSQARGRLRWDDRIGAPRAGRRAGERRVRRPRHRRGPAGRAAVRALRRRRGRGLRRPGTRLHRRRRPPRDRRRAHVRRARQALHDDRHRLRPGQDRERERDPRRGGVARRPSRRARHDDVPPAVHAGLVRARRGSQPRCALRPGARDPDPPVAPRERRRDGERRPVAPAALLPAGRRVDGRRRAPRVPRRPRAGRHAGREHAREDRRAGPGRGRVPEPHVHERVRLARGRPRAVRADVQARRDGLRRRRRDARRRTALSRHDDDRQRGARARPHGGVAPDRVARAAGLAHLGHGAVGHGRRRRARLA